MSKPTKRILDFWNLPDEERSRRYRRMNPRVKRRRAGKGWRIELDKASVGGIAPSGGSPRYQFNPNANGARLGLHGFYHYTMNDIRMGVVIRLAEVYV